MTMWDLNVFCVFLACLVVRMEFIESCVDFQPFGPKNSSILYGEAKGRLGNQLVQFALVSQVAREINDNEEECNNNINDNDRSHHVRGFIDRAAFDALTQVFTVESLDVSELYL